MPGVAPRLTPVLSLGQGRVCLFCVPAECRTGNGMTEYLASPLSFSRGLESNLLSLFEKRSVQRRKKKKKTKQLAAAITFWFKIYLI